MKVVIFDIWGDWGHFKKFYTTASPLTFHLPPPTAIRGIVGAILGLSAKPDNPRYYLKELSGLLCAVQILAPIKTMRMGYNWIETKHAKMLSRIPSESGRYQTIIESLKDPSFRLYLAFPQKEEILENLAGLLRDHCSIYTPYLGISEHIAEFQFVEETHAREEKGEGMVSLSSVLPLSFFSEGDSWSIQIEEGKQYQRDRIPVSMKENRMVTHYEPVLYEISGQTLSAKPTTYWEFDHGKKILFFPV